MLPGFPEAAPLQGLIGGVLIGLAAALMLLGAGRIAGVSGILARGTALAGGSMARTSAWGFLVGLPLGALAIRFGTDWEPAVFASWPVLVVAGLLVGHGVCGVSRLSQRSIVATTAFMAAGIATVFIMSLVGA